MIVTLESAREAAARLDGADDLAPMRDQFDLGADVLYFDGNSLGPPTRAARDALLRAVDHQWGERLIRAWDEDWMAMPTRVGDAIAPLIGAPPGTVIACDNTSVNLHKTLAAAVALRPGRREIVVDGGNFPTDLYIAASVARQHGLDLIAVPADEITSAITERTAVVTATHVDYRSARLLDMAHITATAHSHGALTVWDLAHSVGAVEVDATACGIDFAVGCGYKYLNGGPGAPAFVHVAPGLIEDARQPLQGWWGHADPFEFETEYRPAAGIDRFLTGSPNILSLTALEAALSVFEGVPMARVRAKSESLTTFLVDLWHEHLEPRGFSLASPREAELRGSHVALGFGGGKALVETLAEHGVLADFRPPNLLRFGLAPLYNSHFEVVRLVENMLAH
ncbi:MAG: kynureninase [Actinomycetota bacterium]